ncbi:MAG: hypothetical protein COB67_12760 [SAR324 cluster bacterium]|uniref:Uncharacterized protein n=1 Tax=SAR324 cluster bacterium TaxID=2024889 RepID=A0A2A4SQM9_9DELT|nr:MAG: hypothetical protein COB67_12760 [SAR324 cluster bacterium]
MLKKLDAKIRALMIEVPDENFVTEELQDNPMAGYLKIFQKQHRVIFILYRGLILSFGGLLIVMSVLVYNAAENVLIPAWGTFLLGGIDLFLFLGMVKAFRELSSYKLKSQQVLNKIHDHLRSDLEKLEKIKTEHAGVTKTQQKVHKKLRLLAGKSLLPKAADYSGWDQRLCPSCNSILEMSREECPNCHQLLDKLPDN